MVEWGNSFFELTRLAEKERSLRGNPPSINELADRFEKAVRGSGAFLWMGVVVGNAPEERSIVDVYLSERIGKRILRKVQEASADAVETFDDLALALEHSQLMITLHLVRTSECPPRQLRRRLEDLCVGTNRSLVYQQTLR